MEILKAFLQIFFKIDASKVAVVVVMFDKFQTFKRVNSDGA